MEEMRGQRMNVKFHKILLVAMIFMTLACLGLVAGITWSTSAHAAEDKKPRIVYPKRTELDFDGARIEGEMRNPGEFYFQHRPEEKFDSLVKRRKNFHREMLRDAVLSK